MTVAGPDRLAYSINEAVNAVPINRVALYGLISDGTLRTVQIAGRRLISAESLRALADGYVRPPQNHPQTRG